MVCNIQITVNNQNNIIIRVDWSLTTTMNSELKQSDTKNPRLTRTFAEVRHTRQEMACQMPLKQYLS
jgi:hypothetical protein